MTEPFARWPRDFICSRGYTAKLPESTEVGRACQVGMNHAINWRYDGVHFLTNWRPNTISNDATGKYYPIMHYPPTLDASDRGIAIGYAIWGNAANGAWYVKFEDAVAGYAQETIRSGNNDAPSFSEGMTPEHVGCYTTRYKPPDSGAANLHQGNFKALEIETSNIYVASLTIWHIEKESSLDSDLVPVTLDTVSSGHIISENADSLLGLYEIIGDGSDDVTSMERCSRRVFFNEAHPDGIAIPSTTAWANLFGGIPGWEFPARAREFENCDSERYCYPAFVIKTSGCGAINTAYIRVTSDCSSNNIWTYTVQDAEPDGAEYLITPAMAGSSNSRGVRVKSEADDSLLIEVKTDTGVTMDVESWMCAEGPAWP